MNRVLLTVKEASELTGLCPNRIYELCKQNKFPHVRFDHQVRIPRKALLAFLGETETTEPTRPPEPLKLLVDITGVDPRELGEALLAVLRRSAKAG